MCIPGIFSLTVIVDVYRVGYIQFHGLSLSHSFKSPDLLNILEEIIMITEIHSENWLLTFVSFALYVK